MSLEQNKAIVLQAYKAANQGNLEQMKEMIAMQMLRRVTPKYNR